MDPVEPTLFDDLQAPGASAPVPAGPARVRDPDTSQHAGKQAELGFQRHRYDTLWLYRGYGETDDDATIKSAALNGGEEWHPGTTAKRRQRLAARGLITERRELTGSVLYRATRHGVPAIVWCLTTAGRDQLERWRNEVE